jgi:hypothetical protein
LAQLDSRDLTELQALFELKDEEERDRNLERKAVSGLKKTKR